MSMEGTVHDKEYTHAQEAKQWLPWSLVGGPSSKKVLDLRSAPH